MTPALPGCHIGPAQPVQEAAQPAGRPDQPGHAGWEREPDHPERAEIAFAIADAMQHNGLGTILLGQLTQAADQAGVAVLSAEVLPQNHRMLHVFHDSGFPLATRTLPGVVLVELATSRSRAALERFESRYRVPSHSE